MICLHTHTHPHTHTETFYFCVVSSFYRVGSSFGWFLPQNAHCKCAIFMCIPPQSRKGVSDHNLVLSVGKEMLQGANPRTGLFPSHELEWSLLPFCRNLVTQISSLYQVTSQCSSKIEGLDL